jgi:hypothetical protein
MPFLDASESRFVSLEGSLESLAKYGNTKQTVDISLLKARPPFVIEKPDPNYNPEKLKSHISEVKMSKSSGHNFDGLFKKPFNIPDSLDLHKAQNSF